MSMASTSRPLPRPLHLVLNSTGTSGLPTPLSASANAPLSAPLCLNVKEAKDSEVKSKFQPRRQSSISYTTSSSQVRSPTLGLVRSNSLGSKAALASERTRGDETGFSKVSSLPEVRETEPITLAEKHADLLRFIAQKESKCLELRTQLAQHEADLLLLKRKWERIVSKGLPSSARLDMPTTVGSEMLDGIRESVHSGLGRVFAALEPSPAGLSSTSQPPLSTPQFKSGRHSQSVVKEAPTSSGKRASISTVSSGSAWDRSSLSGSRSSASSLFDDLPSSDRRSSTSSIEGGNTRPSPETEEASAAAQSPQAARRNSPSPVHSLLGKDKDTSMPESDPSSKKLRSRPTSTNPSHLPSSLSASAASESSTPLSRQMANWVPPGLNKKWEELKSNETLSKQSKRASVLLTDVLAVLAPPIPPSPKTTSYIIPKRNSKPSQPPSHHNLDSSFFDSTISNAGSVRVSLSPSPSPSLLDEENECKLGEVLQPQVKVPGAPKETAQNETEEDKEEEDWNW